MTRLTTILHYAWACARIEQRCAFFRLRFGTLLGTVGLMGLIGVIGTLFSAILKREIEDPQHYLLSLGSGLIIWTFLATSLNDSCAKVMHWARMLRHTPAPIPALPLAVLFHNGMIFLQNMVAGLILVLLFLDFPAIRGISLMVGLVLFLIILFAASLTATMVSFRFRSFPQAVSGLLQAGFFVTPLLWPEYFLGRYHYLNDFNPLYHLVALLRLPLTGEPTPLLTWGVAGACAVVSVSTAGLLYRARAGRLPYWL